MTNRRTDERTDERTKSLIKMNGCKKKNKKNKSLRLMRLKVAKVDEPRLSESHHNATKIDRDEAISLCNQGSSLGEISCTG